MRIHCACLICSTPFTISPSQGVLGAGKYCSRPCFNAGRRQHNRDTLGARFWSRVTKTTTCWLWTGDRKPAGYGTLLVGRRHTYAHRLAYELTYGLILPGMECMHRCDNPPCVRPDHLFLGMHGDNVRDMVAKGRHRNMYTR